MPRELSRLELYLKHVNTDLNSLNIQLSHEFRNQKLNAHIRKRINSTIHNLDKIKIKLTNYKQG